MTNKSSSKIYIVICTDTKGCIQVDAPFTDRYKAEQFALSYGNIAGKENMFVLDIDTVGEVITHGIVSVKELEKQGFIKL